MAKKKKSKVGTGIIVVLLILGLIGAGLYFGITPNLGQVIGQDTLDGTSCQVAQDCYNSALNQGVTATDMDEFNQLAEYVCVSNVCGIKEK